MELPTIAIGPHRVSRMTIGGNPFSGHSHQGAQRNVEMMDYYSAARIKQTLADCAAAGINTCCLRTDAHICRMLREFRNEGGRIQWIAQMGAEAAEYKSNVNQAVANGAVAYYIHGNDTDTFYRDKRLDGIAEMINYIHDKGIPAGVAGHSPEAHLAVYEAGIPADFHVVCFYNCGALHPGKGDLFNPADPAKAVEAIRKIRKPCIAYKILGAGRVPAPQAFTFAFANIKPTDAVNVGMFTKDNPRMVQENVELALRAIGA